MMHSPRVLLHCVVLGAAALLASCGESAPPPPPKTELPQPVALPVNAELERLAAEVYVYAYPLVLTDVTREIETAGAASNVFRHNPTLPDASSTNVATPNADFLYSKAWLDLSDGPVIMEVPDTRGRYYLVAMLDAWTNVVASLGPRTTGTGKGRFAIVGPHWKGKLPGGVFEVRSPTELAWLFGRIQAVGGADREAAAKLQSQIKLTRIGSGKAHAKTRGRESPSPAPIDDKTPARAQIAKMDAATFYTRFAKLLSANPPAKDDAPMLPKLKALGIEAGHPFDVGKLDEVSARSVEEGAKSALDKISAAAKGGSGGDIRNGWMFDVALGRWGTDYGKRAVAAAIGLGLNAPEDAIFMATRVDADGHPLDGANRYVLRFDSHRLPPADGFWSLTLYDEAQHLVANTLDRYNLGSDSGLKANEDGSLDIYLQNGDPGPDEKANWLPAPKGNFNVVLRIYWPKQDVVDGKWLPPRIRTIP